MIEPSDSRWRSRGLILLLLTSTLLQSQGNSIVFFPHQHSNSTELQLRSAPPWPPCSKFADGKCAPAILIAGCKKCGTNMLHALLQKHPTVAFPGLSSKGRECISSAGRVPFGEIKYLSCEMWGKDHFTNTLYHCLDVDSSFTEAVAIYSNMFDSTDWKTSFAVDRSPFGHHGPYAAMKLWKISPHTRVIVTICNPIARAWSALNHIVKVKSKQSRYSNITKDTVDAWLKTMVQQTIQAITKYNLTTSGLQGVHTCLINENALKRQHVHGSLANVCFEVLLPGFYKKSILEFEKVGFRPHQIIVVDVDLLYKNMERGTSEIFQALSIPFNSDATLGHVKFVNSGNGTNKWYQSNSIYDLETFNDMLSKVYHFEHPNTD